MTAEQEILWLAGLLEGEGANARAIPIMRQVLPFMGQRRSAKIEEIIHLYETRVTVQQGVAASNRRCAALKRAHGTGELFAVA